VAKGTNIAPSSTALVAAIYGAIILGAAGLAGIPIIASSPLLLLGEASHAVYILHFPIWLWRNHYTRVAYQVNLPLGIDFAIYLTMVLGLSILA